MDGIFGQQQVGALEFPGTKGINGYVVGIVVEKRTTIDTGWDKPGLLAVWAMEASRT